MQKEVIVRAKLPALKPLISSLAYEHYGLSVVEESLSWGKDEEESSTVLNVDKRTNDPGRLFCTIGRIRLLSLTRGRTLVTFLSTVDDEAQPTAEEQATFAAFRGKLLARLEKIGLEDVSPVAVGASHAGLSERKSTIFTEGSETPLSVLLGINKSQGESADEEGGEETG
ncbi:MAG: hypothetical protein ACE5NP_12480 [Anaerolineae bacterium]